MKERFNAKISANINDFLRKMSQVDKKVKETAFEHFEYSYKILPAKSNPDKKNV